MNWKCMMLACAGAIAMGGTQAADNWPTQPPRGCRDSPGGGRTRTARTFAKYLSEERGETVVVANARRRG